MFDVLITDRNAAVGCYQAHQFVVDRLDQIGVVTPERDHLFAIDPLASDRIVLRTPHPTAAVLGQPRPIPEVGMQDYDFCVRVSPMQRGLNQKRIPATDLARWRAKHLGEAQGVQINKVFERASMTFCKRGQGFWLPDVIMVGRLTVIDPVALMAVMQTGIGRHRAFGFGLLQLFPLTQRN